MITLDPVQALALRKAAVEPVKIAGSSGTGKSTLANAIASQSSRRGKSCLLIGTSAILDRAAGYRVLGEVHQAVADRAQLGHSSSSRSGKLQRPGVLRSDPVEARARANPARARVAVSTLRRARELAARHDLQPSEIEQSLAADRPLAPEAANFLSLAVQDASRIADVLWSGNRRAGRNLKDVDDVSAGRPVEVPPEDDALSLILANDQEYEAALAKILSSHKELEGEHALSKSIASLRRPRSSDRTLSEYHKHASTMARTFASAIALIKKHGNLKAALAAGSGTDAAKAIEYVIRMRPEQGAGASVRTFEAAVQDYRHDSAVIEPLLAEHGHRALGSFSSAPTARESQLQEIGTLIQRLREARYAARHLPAHLQSLRTSLPKAQFERIFTAPIEEAFSVLEGGTPDPRAMAATEMRQLRELFASTGFGDLLGADEDFVAKVERASAAPPEAVASLPQPYNPQVLDLLLDLTTFTEQHEAAEWPVSVTRARTAQEALDAISGPARFDVVVIDDVSDYPLYLADALETSGATVHRIGVTHYDAAIVLEMPHRQSDADIAAAVSGQPNRWLGASGSFGIVVRTDPRLESTQLASAADRLVSELRSSGCDVAQASTGQEADVIVASVDELRDADVAAFARKARQGIAVVCRSNRRLPPAMQDSGREPDIKIAESLGWRVSRTAIDGTVLEKDGRSVALIREPIAISPGDETAADVANRLTALGWHPVVLWQGAERAPHELESLLAGHSVLTGTNPFRKIAETFSLADPQPPVANEPGPGIDDGAQPAAEELEEQPAAAAAAAARQLPESAADGVSSDAVPDASAEADGLSSDGGAREDHDFRHPLEYTDARPLQAAEIRTEDVPDPAREETQDEADSDDGETDAAEPPPSGLPEFGLAVESGGPQETAPQDDDLETDEHQEAAETLEERPAIAATTAVQPPKSVADGVSSDAVPDASAEADGLSSDGGAREDHDFRHPLEYTDARPLQAAEIRTEDVSDPAREETQDEADSDDGETDAAEPPASGSPEFGRAVEPGSPLETAPQDDDLETDEHQEAAEGGSLDDDPETRIPVPAPDFAADRRPTLIPPISRFP
jgi:hypothetical protein